MHSSLPPPCLPLLDGAEDGFEVDDRRAVDRLEAADMQAWPIDAEDAYPMQADRVGSARGSGAEDALLWPLQVSSRMYGQAAAVGLVQPAQHDELVPDGDAVQAGLEIGIQHQVRVGRAFISLPRRICCRDERTLDATYRADGEIVRGVVGHAGHSITCRVFALDHPMGWWQDGVVAEAEKTEKITLNLGLVDLGQIDLLVQEGFYANRTDFLRTAARAQLAVHADALQRTVERKTIVLGLENYTRQQLEDASAAGRHLQIRVLGLATIADDVTPELALATIESVEVLGAFRASAAVKAALRDRIR